MSFPNVDDVRARIEAVEPYDIRYVLECAYLFCGRISELVSESCPGDKKTVPRGPTGKDVGVDTFEFGPLKVEVAIFNIKTAKRQGKPRLIALPLDKKYESWTEEILDYYNECGSKPLFPFTRQRAWQHSKEAFEGLTYPIDRYIVTKKSELEKITVNAHNRAFRLHALRHLRTTELITVYGFDGIDLSIYGGWTLRSMLGVGSSMERYAHLQWQKYFPKLLRR